MNRATPERLALLLALVGACNAEPPTLDRPPTSLADSGVPGYADIVISFAETGPPTTCTDAISAVCAETSGVCANHPALGAPDNSSFTLQGDGLLEVGFLCNPIVDRADGGNAPIPDFRILATVGANNSAVVSVSEDGANFVSLGNLNVDNESFHISDENLDFVRFVRISGEGGQPIAIDAIEALP